MPQIAGARTYNVRVVRSQPEKHAVCMSTYICLVNANPNKWMDDGDEDSLSCDAFEWICCVVWCKIPRHNQEQVMLARGASSGLHSTRQTIFMYIYVAQP